MAEAVAQTSGGKGIRTPDIQLAKLALYQLSYTPVVDSMIPQNSQNSQNSQNTQNTQNTQNSQNSQGTTEALRAKSPRPQVGGSPPQEAEVAGKNVARVAMRANQPVSITGQAAFLGNKQAKK